MNHFTFDPAPFELDSFTDLLSHFPPVSNTDLNTPSSPFNVLNDAAFPWILQPEPLWNPFLSADLPSSSSSSLNLLPSSSTSPDSPPFDTPHHLTLSPTTTLVPSPIAADFPLASAPSPPGVRDRSRLRKYRKTIVPSVPSQYQGTFLAAPEGIALTSIASPPPVSIEPCDWSLCKCKNKTRKPARHFRTKCPYNSRLEKYACAECGESFTRKDNMVRHRWRAHRLK